MGVLHYLDRQFPGKIKVDDMDARPPSARKMHEFIKATPALYSTDSGPHEFPKNFDSRWTKWEQVIDCYVEAFALEYMGIEPEAEADDKESAEAIEDRRGERKKVG